MISEAMLRRANPADVRRLAEFLGLKCLPSDDVVLWVSLSLCQRGPL